MALPAFTFEKAVKHAAKARVALVGPSGSGKSYTGLVLARELAGPDGTIAAVDTEHGTLEKYADLFDFSHVKLDSFTAINFFATLKSAEDAGFSVILYDSLSHFWMGKDGTLEFVDERTKTARSKGADQMTGWKDWSPTERAMIDAILQSPLHVVVTMRTKTEYREVEYTKRDGQKGTKREKVGLMPVQRQGLEYEFDLIGYMDDENTFITDKTRCVDYRQKALTTPTGKDFRAFKKWLDGKPSTVVPTPVVIPPQPDIVVGSREAQQIVANAKLTLLQTANARADEKSLEPALRASIERVERSKGTPLPSESVPVDQPIDDTPTTKSKYDPAALMAHFRQMTDFKSVCTKYAWAKERMHDLKGQTGIDTYYSILDGFKMKHANDFGTLANAHMCFEELWRKIWDWEQEIPAVVIVNAAPVAPAVPPTKLFNLGKAHALIREFEDALGSDIFMRILKDEGFDKLELVEKKADCTRIFRLMDMQASILRDDKAKV